MIWYRLHVKIDPPDRGLALSEVKVAGAFEIYVNGERLIASGRIAPFVPYTSDARLVGRIPDRMLASGSVVIALRVHFSPLEWTVGQNPGLYADNLAIGQERTLYRDNWLYSDGVIEAQRPDGELFGFERAREVSVRPAAEIVETVKRFGQEDDITVVTVTRTTTVATAA